LNNIQNIEPICEGGRLINFIKCEDWANVGDSLGLMYVKNITP